MHKNCFGLDWKKINIAIQSNLVSSLLTLTLKSAANARWYPQLKCYQAQFTAGTSRIAFKSQQLLSILDLELEHAFVQTLWMYSPIQSHNIHFWRVRDQELEGKQLFQSLSKCTNQRIWNEDMDVEPIWLHKQTYVGYIVYCYICWKLNINVYTGSD